MAYEITTAGARLTFDSISNLENDSCFIDETHILNVWTGDGNDGYAQVFELNKTDWSLTPLGTAFEYDTAYGLYGRIAQIDTNHYLLYRVSPNPKKVKDLYGQTQVMYVNTNTWAISLLNTPTLFIDSPYYKRPAKIEKLDSNHFLIIAGGGSSTSATAICVCEVNLSTWKTTKKTEKMELGGYFGRYGLCKMDDYKYLLVGQDYADEDFYASPLFINPITYITTVQTRYKIFKLTGQQITMVAVKKIDSSHYLVFYNREDEMSGSVALLYVNPSTYIPYSLGDTNIFFKEEDNYTVYEISVEQIDITHYVVFFKKSGTLNSFYVKSIEIDLESTNIIVYSTYNEDAGGDAITSLKVDDGHYICSWRDKNKHGVSQVFNVEVPQSSSISSSISPSSSASPSVSPSNSPSISPSSSVSPSISPSASDSPSLSQSSSVSSSISPSNSPSLSPSSSISPSYSPSSSISPSISPSSSISPSNSPSLSPSASPSPGWAGYSRMEYETLPTNDDDLDILYTEDDYGKVSYIDNIYVDQSADPENYSIHLFKDFVNIANTCNIECSLKTNLNPMWSTVYLQIFNRNTNEWETIDYNDSPDVDINFILESFISDLSNYKDGNNVVSCRIYQLAV